MLYVKALLCLKFYWCRLLRLNGGGGMLDDLATLARICRGQAESCVDRSLATLLLNMARDYDRRAAGIPTSGAQAEDASKHSIEPNAGFVRWVLNGN